MNGEPPPSSAPGGLPEGELWRLFVAIALDDPARQALAGLQHRWRQAGADVAWVRPENLHLTLAFLGDTASGRVPSLAAALTRRAAATPPFDIEIRGWGAFGRPGRPRVLWAGVAASPALEHLHAALATDLRGLGFDLEPRPFAAHVTLGRVRSSRRLTALTSLLASTINEPAASRVRVESVLLVRSRLTAAGPIYETVNAAELKGRNDHGQNSEDER